MKIHTDKISRNDLYAALPEGLHLEVKACGSRKRDHAFEVSISAIVGTDRHGNKRSFAASHSIGEFHKAATWVEWGDWMVELFKIDTDAIIGVYKGAGDFTFRTGVASTQRDAEEDAARWNLDLRVNSDLVKA